MKDKLIKGDKIDSKLWKKLRQFSIEKEMTVPESLNHVLFEFFKEGVKK